MMTGYEVVKTLDCLNLLSRDHPDVVREARINVIYRKGAEGYCGALGLNWRQCQMLFMENQRQGFLDPIQRGVYRQATELLVRFSLEDLEEMQLEEGTPQSNPERAYDSYRLA